jgi:hypothetical protein
MQLIRSVTAYYPAFELGYQPQVVQCELAIVEANGERYFKTPFALLNAYSDDEPERAIRNCQYYATAEDCQAYLDNQYPWAKQAEPLMDALYTSREHYGPLVGTGRIADRCGVDDDELFRLCRGHKRCTLKSIRAAIRRLKAEQVPA